MASQVPFDLETALARVREAVRPFPPAALFQLADEGYSATFEQLVAGMISIRTRDEVTLPVARRFFAAVRTPAAVSALPEADIDMLIRASTFHQAKARQIRALAQQTVERYGGVLPCDYGILTSFAGVGPKCANLVLGIACGQPRIGVDIHVHRVTNRWGYVSAPTPEATLVALEAVVPVPDRLALNRLLVPFGKFICTGAAPRCSTCPLLAMCAQIGVGTHR